jgi:hypothetical protein
MGIKPDVTAYYLMGVDFDGGDSDMKTNSGTITSSASSVRACYGDKSPSVTQFFISGG